jgi:hypothetical protein
MWAQKRFRWSVLVKEAREVWTRADPYVISEGSRVKSARVLHVWESNSRLRYFWHMLHRLVLFLQVDEQAF